MFEKVEVGHSDGRRSIIPIFNGDFVARQAKAAQVNKAAILGGHFHDYAEMFYVVEGLMYFTLKDTRTKEDDFYRLEPRCRLAIPPFVAHKAEAKADTLLLGFTEKRYVSAAENDRKYEF